MNRYIVNNIDKYKKVYDLPDLKISKSDRKGKRFKATYTDYDGKRRKIYFGQDGAYTYADGAPDSKRRAYRARASAQYTKAGKQAISIPGSAASLSYNILW
ncbi:DUF5754 domain-containing protein [Megavirus chiliensis]|uniref:Uncharacterized protein n=2 Tax=Megamimivirinae TaxID=3044648 RepID=A0A2L2DP75_MIMIV|nr:hypothetical protein MegaChil _gp1113 [Megavirus chiliensis]AEQ32758.1 DUF5754 domain-containing protein [Megavirus chiliensis]AVG47947.1 hypothetical protein [Acanthamoeba polyphaga mimivirus]